MRALAVLRALGPIDAKIIRRDSCLGWVLFLPLLIAALVRWGVPWLTDRLEATVGFDLVPYHMLIASYVVVLMVPLLVGQIIGFLLLARAGFEPVATWQIVYAILVLALSAGLLLRLAERSFLHFVTRSRGVHAT